MARAAADAQVRALIVTGAGEKAFVAGADINQLAALTPIEAQAYAERGQRVFRAIEMLAKPTLAAINGYALGGGLELAMSCAVRVASENARLGQPEVKLGILPGYGGTQRLPRLVGRGRALEMLLSGEPVTAAEAHRIGLVNHVVPQAELLEFSRQWLRKVLANAPLALGLILQAVDVGLEAGLEQGLRFEAAAFGLTTATEDKRRSLAVRAGQGHVGAIYVLPEVQGHGIGSRLLGCAFDWWGNQKPVHLCVASYNQRAIHFYEQHGFTKTEREHDR